MKNETQLMTTTAITEFKNAWIAGMNSLLKAAQIYVKAIDADENAREKFRDAMPKVSSVVWARIENVGRGTMHYSLLCDSSPAAERIRKLPFSAQKDVIECGVNVLTEDGTTLKVKPENLTVEMAQRVIAKDHIRDIPEQKAYIESKKIIAKTNAVKPKDLYEVKNKMLHVYAPTAFTRQQLISLLQDIG